MPFICAVKTWNNIISLINNSNDFITLEETSKYSVKSSDFLTDDDEKNQEIVSDLEKGLYRKRMLSYGGLLKQKHKILNLDDAEDGNLINTSDEDKTTDEEKKHIQLPQFGISKSKLLFKTLVITDVFFYCFSVKKCCLIFVTNAVCSVTKVWHYSFVWYHFKIT